VFRRKKEALQPIPERPKCIEPLEAHPPLQERTESGKVGDAQQLEYGDPKIKPGKKYLTQFSLANSKNRLQYL